MSQELEALEIIKNRWTKASGWCDELISIECSYEVGIIEKALKALEIIKKTPIFAWYITIYKDAYEMVADAKGFRTNESVEELQKKFDLLKEVLK